MSRHEASGIHSSACLWLREVWQDEEATFRSHLVFSSLKRRCVRDASRLHSGPLVHKTRGREQDTDTQSVVGWST